MAFWAGWGHKPAMRVALIDHYDSFTFNVIDWLASAGQDLPTAEPLEVHYVAFDDAAAMAAVAATPLPLVLSPGPKRPEDATATLALVRALLGRVPILGICLGHQVLAVAAGAQVGRAPAPMHGTTRSLQVGAVPGLLAGLQPRFQAAVYNSLTVEPATLPRDWHLNAVCTEGEVQAMSREVRGEAPAFGLQFHPESFLSEGAAQIRRNWLDKLRVSGRG